MSSPHNRPKWWQVYLTLPLLVLLFISENRLRLSVRGHQVIQIGIVLLIYILIHLWLKANSGALSNVDRRHPSRAFRVYQIPPAPLSGSGSEEQSTIRIYGVLGTTFEMDYIDAECIEAGEVPQELKKE
jgi:hypothetical protein